MKTNSNTTIEKVKQYKKDERLVNIENNESDNEEDLRRLFDTYRSINTRKYVIGELTSRHLNDKTNNMIIVSDYCRDLIDSIPHHVIYYILIKIQI